MMALNISIAGHYCGGRVHVSADSAEEAKIAYEQIMQFLNPEYEPPRCEMPQYKSATYVSIDGKTYQLHNGGFIPCGGFSVEPDC